MILMIMPAECDISVSKLLCFKTFPFILIESDLKNIGIGKVSVSVSKKIGIDKSICFERNWNWSFLFLAYFYHFWTPSVEQLNTAGKLHVLAL